jgi:hypothetical protein
MRPWQFSKPKTPGFGISTRAYLTVLSSRSILPSLLQVLNPGGEGGAVAGFGVPAAAGKTRASLAEPMERGRYGLFSKDKKTCLEAMVLSTQEAGFDPEAFAHSGLAQRLDPEIVARIRGTWTLLQLRFQTHDAAVYPSLRFALEIAQRLALLCEGVVADPLAARYRLPEQVFHSEPLDPRVDARDHVATHRFGTEVHTLGMQKFLLDELNLPEVPEESTEAAEAFLALACQKALLGDLIRPGDLLGAPSMPFEAVRGVDQGRWEGVPVLDLLPPKGATVRAALRAWLESNR